jgi:hypothetical protein
LLRQRNSQNLLMCLGAPEFSLRRRGRSPLLMAFGGEGEEADCWSWALPYRPRFLPPVGTGGPHQKRGDCRIASMIATMLAAPKIAANKKSPCDSQEHSRQLRTVIAPTARAALDPALSFRTLLPQAGTDGPGLGTTRCSGGRWRDNSGATAIACPRAASTRSNSSPIIPHRQRR